MSVFIIAEIGLNHNGDVAIAKKLIDIAAFSGCDAVKFQKRTPDICVPEAQKGVMRDTPWGRMTYLDYRYRVEFGKNEYDIIDKYCRSKGIQWFASPWDTESQKFLHGYDLQHYKIPSAKLTDMALLEAVASDGRHTFISTGMSTMQEIETAVNVFRKHDCPFELMHCISTYPMENKEANLSCIQTLRQVFKCRVGYSGHERGLQITVAAVALGATSVERHITIDRSMWGSDHAASLEPGGLLKLVRDVRVIEDAVGDGVKRVLQSEVPIRAKLRGDKPAQQEVVVVEEKKVPQNAA